MPHNSLKAIILLAAMLKPSGAKRLVMLARGVKLLDDQAAELIIVALALEQR